MADEEKDRLLELAEKLDKGDSYYEKRMQKKAEQSRMAQLQAPPKRGKKPPVSEEAVEKAVEKRKGPFTYRPDYKPKEKLAGEEALIQDLIIGNSPDIQRTRAELLSGDISHEDMMKRSMSRMRDLHKVSIFNAEVARRKKGREGRQFSTFTRRRLMGDPSVTYGHSDGTMHGRIATEHELKTAGTRAHLIDLYSEKGLENIPNKEPFLKFLKRKKREMEDAKQDKRDKELPPRKPQPGDEEYYFGKEKK